MARVGAVVADGSHWLMGIRVADQEPGAAAGPGYLGVPVHLLLAGREVVVTDAVVGDDIGIREAAIDVDQVAGLDGAQLELGR
ncbi:hypothetical protein D3C78_1394070 [compost metagenome]